MKIKSEFFYKHLIEYSELNTLDLLYNNKIYFYRFYL